MINNLNKIPHETLKVNKRQANFEINNDNYRAIKHIAEVVTSNIS